MSNNIIFLVFLFLVVATNFVIVFFIRKHPEKISGFKLEGSENEIVEKLNWVNLLCRMIVIGNILTLIGGIVAVCFENILIFSLLVSLPVPLGIVYAYSKKNRSNYTGSSNKNGLIVTIVSICVLFELFGLLAVSYHGNGNLDIVTNQDELVINGLYGTNISYRDIKEIGLKSNLPEIKFRSNGFAVGYTRLGNFITQDDSHIMLFTHSDSCFIRIVTKKDEVYYLSCQESDETVKVFKEIKKHL
ncbi:MAG: PH domain-containing protein [Prevotella sp.]|nr:PH domain-containing protein [Prevotella sp.]